MWANIKYTITSFANSYEPGHDLEADIVALSFQTVIAASLILLVLLGIGSLVRERIPKLNTPIFILICLNVLVATFVLLGSTVYLNTVSVSKGPVHYHADLEVWACDQELELRNPIGAFSNKIGTSTLHEHDDKRIHLEGVVVDERDASLGKFFYVIGGGISAETLVFPTTSGETFEDPITKSDQSSFSKSERNYLEETYVATGEEGNVAEFIDGDACADGQTGDVQTFVYFVGTTESGEVETRIDDGVEKTVYYQMKLDNPSDYIITGESIVPNGDCVIVEFGPTKSSTDRLCEQYEVNDTGRRILNEDGEEVDSLGTLIYGGVVDADGNPVDESQPEEASEEEPENESTNEKSPPFGNESNPNYDQELDDQCALEFEGTADPSTECAIYREELLEGEEDA